ncbi:membrane fusion protein, multidrug efflux system [Lutibacter agarilyticus]|uniref:Membrane fusion protein, multidrug efflux system n=1 Tax=Lutibacter agarilyticus TaxID=1109740 RepID=A0A238VJ55_9FLAO|nr:efflux RND transporter periplasmic adaptor subunit [Lutibacter agarilyticus]SNR33743.1 membrane fusion protein, multidrug efflux system [Lutibacter agarilyticus]
MKLRSIILALPLFIYISCKEKEQPKMPPQQIKVVEVVKKDIPIFNYFVGEVFGQEDVSINARVEGYLTSILFTEGARVKKGDLLYTIDPEPFNAAIAGEKSKVTEAQTKYLNSENNLARIKPLAEMDAVSKSDLDFALADRDASLAARKAAEASLKMAQINLSYTQIKAPINGFIGKTQARVGDFVGRSPNPVIINTISKVENVRVQFFINETNYLTLAKAFAEIHKDIVAEERAQKAEIELLLTDGTTHPHKGVIDFINREIDASTGAILVQASFPNPELILKPGQYARVKVKSRVEKGALLVPQRVVSELQGEYSVFIVNADNKIESRRITIGDDFDDYYIVKEGITEDDKIVFEGLQKVGTGLEVVPEITVFESQFKKQ